MAKYTAPDFDVTVYEIQEKITWDGEFVSMPDEEVTTPGNDWSQIT